MGGKPRKTGDKGNSFWQRAAESALQKVIYDGGKIVVIGLFGMTWETIASSIRGASSEQIAIIAMGWLIFACLLLFVVGNRKTRKKAKPKMGWRILTYAVFALAFSLVVVLVKKASPIVSPVVKNDIEKPQESHLWISDISRRSFVSTNAVNVSKATPITIVYRNAGNLKGAQELHELLKAANFSVSDTFRLDIKDRGIVGYSVMYNWSANAKTQCLQDGHALLSAMNASGIRARGDHESDVPVDELYIYVGKLD